MWGEIRERNVVELRWNCKGDWRGDERRGMWLDWNGISEMKSDTECDGVLGDFFYFDNPKLTELYPLIVIIIIVIVT